MNDVLYILMLIVLLSYGALLAMPIPGVRFVPFLSYEPKSTPAKKSEPATISVTLTSITPAIYVRKWWSQTIKISLLTGLFILEGTGKVDGREDQLFKYTWLSVGRRIIGVRTNPDRTHDLSYLRFKPDFNPSTIYVEELKKRLEKTSQGVG